MRGTVFWRWRFLVAGLLLAGGGGLLTSAAHAEDKFPGKPVTIVVGYDPGGSNDVMARNIQPALADKLGVPVIIMNKPGASGMIGANYVAKSAPDGYTLLLTWDAHVINPLVRKDVPYDIFRDFSAVTLLGRFPLIMVAGSALGGHSLGEFVSLLKSKPGTFNYASVGVGSPIQLFAENFLSAAKISATHVPYKGAAPSVQALASGEVAFSFLSYAAVRGFLADGRLKALATTGSKRMQELPTLPTMAEAGFPEAQGYSWVGIVAPAGLPSAIKTRLSQAFASALADAGVQKRLKDAGVEPIGTSPEEFDKYLHQEYDKWSRFVQSSNVRFTE